MTPQMPHMVSDRTVGRPRSPIPVSRLPTITAKKSVVSPDSPSDDRPLTPAQAMLTRWIRFAGLSLVAIALGTTLFQHGGSALFGPADAIVDRGLETALRMTRMSAATILGFVVPGLALFLVPDKIARRPAVLAALVSIAVVTPMLTFHDIRGSGRVWEGDARLYLRMADEWPWRPGGWFRFRVLAPWLARKLAPPFGSTPTWLAVSDGYWRLAAVSIAATGPALSLLLRDLKFGTAARHLGVLLYLASFATLYNSYNYAMPDPLAMLIVVLAARAIVRGRDWELVIWFLVGALTKEIVLYLVPVRWLWGRESGLGVKAALRAGLVAAPALLVFAWLRFQPQEAKAYTEFVTGSAWLFPWKHQPDNVARLYSPFAAGWALIALSLRRPDRWTRAAVGFAIPCVLSLLITDAGRMLVYLTPFAIPAILRAAGADERVSRRGLIAILLVCLSMRLWEPFVPLWQIPVLVRRPLALVLALVCASLVYRITPSRTDASSPASDAYA